MPEITEAIRKLKNLPAEFLPADNPGPYQTARQHAQSFLNAATNLQQRWQSPDKDPATLPKGEAPVVPGLLSTVTTEEGTWVIDTEGNRLTELYSNKILEGGSYVVQWYSDCNKNTQWVEVLDPVSQARLQRFDVPADRYFISVPDFKLENRGSTTVEQTDMMGDALCLRRG